MLSGGSSEVRLTNSLFSGTQLGPAIRNAASELTATNSTFSANYAPSDVCAGVDTTTGGITELVNCVLWGNEGTGGTDEAAQVYAADGTLAVNYSCVQGWTGTLGGSGNLGEDPLFADPSGTDDIVGTEDDNLRLSAGSPGIDAGDNSAVTVATDLDGYPRIVGGTIDMGAYEFGTVPIPTLSEWNFVAMALLVLTAGTLVLARRRRLPVQARYRAHRHPQPDRAAR
jgi:hypothetical protein